MKLSVRKNRKPFQGWHVGDLLITDDGVRIGRVVGCSVRDAPLDLDAVVTRDWRRDLLDFVSEKISTACALSLVFKKAGPLFRGERYLQRRYYLGIHTVCNTPLEAGEAVVRVFYGHTARPSGRQHWTLERLKIQDIIDYSCEVKL